MTSHSKLLPVDIAFNELNNVWRTVLATDEQAGLIAALIIATSKFLAVPTASQMKDSFYVF
jgi:hypothetical protein